MAEASTGPILAGPRGSGGGPGRKESRVGGGGPIWAMKRGDGEGPNRMLSRANLSDCYMQNFGVGEAQQLVFTVVWWWDPSVSIPPTFHSSWGQEAWKT